MEMQDEKVTKKIKMMSKVAAMLMMVGFLMSLSALYLEFTALKPALTTIGETQKPVWENALRADNPALVDARVAAAVLPPMLLTLKLVGVAFILSGIFIVLMGILKALSTMPDKLKAAIKK
ncbi:MAG: hypothetical protein HY517_01175 [Candidatus Aenigmarchaeota archaeon]|nr:hypothetical protein [Candidatus Aenigmarchaeota archaeon]